MDIDDSFAQILAPEVTKVFYYYDEQHHDEFDTLYGFVHSLFRDEDTNNCEVIVSNDAAILLMEEDLVEFSDSNTEGSFCEIPVEVYKPDSPEVVRDYSTENTCVYQESEEEEEDVRSKWIEISFLEYNFTVMIYLVQDTNLEQCTNALEEFLRHRKLFE